MKQFLVLGVINGAVYGLLATGLVLVYKGARVFNFAQAEFGTVAAFFAYWLIEKQHLPYWAGDLLAILGIAIVGFLVERLIVRPLFTAPRVTLLVATAGVALVLIQLQFIIVGANAVQIGPALRGIGVNILDVVVSPQRLLIFGVLVILGLGMGYFFSRTDLGLAVLATSQEPVATELAGIGTRRMSSFIWTFAAVLGGIAGVLLAPTGALFPGFMTITDLLPAFTAAVVGGITSLPGAFLGGLLIGITQGLGEFYFGSSTIVRGAANLLVFAVLVLLVRPKGLIGREA
ncbi:MAG: branched-chain amino acid ABC transporter permease [Actinomycetota bacterium]